MNERKPLQRPPVASATSNRSLSRERGRYRRSRLRPAILPIMSPGSNNTKMRLKGKYSVSISHYEYIGVARNDVQSPFVPA